MDVLRRTERSSSDTASENSARPACWLNVGDDTNLNSTWRLKIISQCDTVHHKCLRRPRFPPMPLSTPQRLSILVTSVWIGQQIKRDKKRERFCDEKQQLSLLSGCRGKTLHFCFYLTMILPVNKIYLTLHIVSSPATYMCHTMCFAEHKCQRPPFFFLYTYQCPHRHSCAHDAREHCG